MVGILSCGNGGCVFEIVALSSERGELADLVIAQCVMQGIDALLYLVAGIFLFMIVFKVDRANAKLAAGGQKL